MRQQISTMLDMQDSMNTKVHPQWREQQFAWYRAIWIECGELLDHYGWKWWKKQEPDLDQVRLELIDIWHFGLSIMLQSGQSKAAIIETLAAAFSSPCETGDFRIDLESFTAEVLSTQAFDSKGFFRLMKGINLSVDDLYRGYVGKNVLNFFRQDNGYQDGTYRKTWQGREDNEHLVELVNELDASSQGFKDLLYDSLARRYQQSE